MCNCNKKVAPVKTTAAVSSKPFSANGFAVANNGTIDTQNISLDESCSEFGFMLGLDNPVPVDVMVAAIKNPGYSKKLLAARGNMPLLTNLLNNPPDKNTSVSNTAFSNRALLFKGGKALLKWAFSSFPTVSAEILKKREDACLACPNLSEPTTAVQRMSASPVVGTNVGTRTGNKICSSCGCVVKNKMRLATESCPESSFVQEGLSRWGE